jgi:predicted nucleic acid-binding protein
VLVVLDASVFVSAAISPGGVASQAVLAGIEGRFTYLLCPHLIDELIDVLARPKIARPSR